MGSDLAQPDTAPVMRKATARGGRQVGEAGSELAPLFTEPNSSVATLSPAALLTLQRRAGNRAVIKHVQRLHCHPVIQRDASRVSYRGQMFTTDAAQIRTMLEVLIGERGMKETESLAYGFLNMSVEDKIQLSLKGIDKKDIEAAQTTLKPVLKQLQDDQKTYVDKFREEATAGALLSLDQSRDALINERDKYAEDGAAPDLDGMRQAAKALAAKRRLADVAAAKAKDALEKMRTQLQEPARPGVVAPPPIVPYFPDAALREAAGTTNQAWFELEQDYAKARATHEAKFPALAMYAENLDGNAASRLEDLPTWGPWADSRMKKKIFDKAQDRIQNNEGAVSDLKGDKNAIWALPMMIDSALKGSSAKAFQQQWVKAEQARVATAKAERARLIAAITIAVALVAVAATAGAAAVPAGTTGAVVFSGIAATAQAGSATLTIATAYQELKEYQLKKAQTQTALDRAQSVSGDDASFLWVAITLAGTILELAALKAAFATVKGSIQAAKASRTAVTLAEDLAKVPNVSKPTAEVIANRVAAEIETLPPPPPQQAAKAAMERLPTWDTIPAAERQGVMLDALRGGGDTGSIVSATGKNARELLKQLGKSDAGRMLQAALNTKAMNEVGPALRAIGKDVVLDDVAVARIVSKNDVGGIKGAILEEVMEAEVKQTLAAGADDAARKALLRGAEGEGKAEFIAGSRITDTSGGQLTDGIVGVLRGEDEIVVIRAMESKAGVPAKGELSREAAKKFAELPQAEQKSLLEDAAKILRRRRADLRSLTPEEVIRDHRDVVMEVIAKEFPQTSEWGQAVKTSQRLGMDVGAAGHDIPAEILVDGVRRKVRFPGSEGRVQVTGVLPKDIKPGRMPAKVAKEQGVKLDMMNVKSVDQAKLKSLAEQVATSKSLPTK